MVTVSKKKSIKEIIDRTVKELWGWSPNAGKRLTIEQQHSSIRDELGFAFRSRGMKATSIEVRASTGKPGALVVECIVDGAVNLQQYDAHPSNVVEDDGPACDTCGDEGFVQGDTPGLEVPCGACHEGADRP